MSSGTESTGSGAVCFPAVAQPLVSILIPCHNQAALLETCLRSLLLHVPASIAFEVVIVLNAATTEVVSFVREKTSGITILESAANLGVAGGYNLARTAARGEHLLLLHDDVEIERLWLETLLETMAGNPTAGAVGSFQFFPDGTPQRAGSILWSNATTSPAWGKGEPDDKILTRVRPVDYVGTCSTLVRAATWDAIGGMDEEIYPAYFVDVDLCMRVRLLGQIVLCDPRSKVKHHQGTSSRKRFRGFLNHRNRGYFTSKWGAELQAFEPADPENPAAIARAEERTVRVAAELSEKWNGYPPSPPPSGTGDPLERERAYFRKEISLLTDYAGKLEGIEARLTKQLEKAPARKTPAPELPVQHPQRRGFFSRLSSAIRAFADSGH